jgi:hypothetical protein
MSESAISNALRGFGIFVLVLGMSTLVLKQTRSTSALVVLDGLLLTIDVVIAVLAGGAVVKRSKWSSPLFIIWGALSLALLARLSKGGTESLVGVGTSLFELLFLVAALVFLILFEYWRRGGLTR